MELPPALRAEGLAPRIVRELGLGAGERVQARVVSDLGNGVYEIQLGQRFLRVASPRLLEAGATLLLAVREARERLVLEILDHRPETPPAPERALGDRLASLGVPDGPEAREALKALLDEGVPVSRSSLEAAAKAAEAFPQSPAEARRAAALLLKAGQEPTPERVRAVMEALKGGALEQAVRLLSASGSPLAKELLSLLLPEGPWSAPGAAAMARVEEAVARVLEKDPTLSSLDRAIAKAGGEPPGDGPESEEAARRLLQGEALPPEERKSGLRFLLRMEREALDRHPELGALKEAGQALGRLQAEDAGRLLLGRDGLRYAEGLFRPPEGPAQRLRVSARREEGGKGKRRTLSVGVALRLSALGEVGALLTSEGRRLEARLQASSPEAETLLRAGAPSLESALRGLGFEAQVGVAGAPAPFAGFFGGAAAGGPPAPLVDLKA